MSTRDWFRKRSWSSADEADFRTHLERARRHKRAQYLRIQAVELREGGDPQHLPIALGLLEEAVRGFPDDFLLAWTHEQQALCLIDLGRPDAAFDALRWSLQAHRAQPSVGTGAGVTFAQLALALHRDALYDEARRYLADIGEQVMSDARYAVCSCRALLADAAGDRAEAADQAREALRAAAAGPAFSRHKDVGTVKVVDPDIHARLLALSAA